MSLDTYTGLKDSIRGWLMNRADIVPMIPDFIVLAETDFNDRVRHRSMIYRKTLVAGAERIPLPLDWLEAVNVQVTDGGTGVSRLRYASPENLDEIRDATAGAAVPTHYSIVGKELELVPSPGPAPGTALIEMIYYGRIPALTDVDPVNWLLTARPDAYLYGALTHAAPYLEEDSRVALWVGARDAAVTVLNDADKRSRSSGGPLQRRLRTFG